MTSDNFTLSYNRLGAWQMRSILGVAVRPVRTARAALVTARLAVLYAVVRREDFVSYE